MILNFEWIHHTPERIHITTDYGKESVRYGTHECLNQTEFMPAKLYASWTFIQALLCLLRMFNRNLYYRPKHNNTKQMEICWCSLSIVWDGIISDICTAIWWGWIHWWVYAVYGFIYLIISETEKKEFILLHCNRFFFFVFPILCLFLIDIILELRAICMHGFIGTENVDEPDRMMLLYNYVIFSINFGWQVLAFLFVWTLK